jgi:hypothetical protein
MLLLEAIGLHRRHDPLLSPLAAPVALGTGAFLLEYAVETARTIEAVLSQSSLDAADSSPQDAAA